MNHGGGFWSFPRVANRFFCFTHYRLLNSASISSDGMLRCRSLELAVKLAAYPGTDLHQTSRGLLGCKIEILSIGKQRRAIAKSERRDYCKVGLLRILAGPNLPQSCNEPHTMKNGVTIAARSNAGITVRRAHLSPPSRGLVPNKCWRQTLPTMLETNPRYEYNTLHLPRRKLPLDKTASPQIKTNLRPSTLYPRNAFDPVPQLEDG